MRDSCCCLAEAGDLPDDVVVGVGEPLVEGDGAALVGVHLLEVLLALLEPLLQKLTIQGCQVYRYSGQTSSGTCSRKQFTKPLEQVQICQKSRRIG